MGSQSICSRGGNRGWEGAYRRWIPMMMALLNDRAGLQEKSKVPFGACEEVPW